MSAADKKRARLCWLSGRKAQNTGGSHRRRAQLEYAPGDKPESTACARNPTECPPWQTTSRHNNGLCEKKRKMPTRTRTHPPASNAQVLGQPIQHVDIVAHSHHPVRTAPHEEAPHAAVRRVGPVHAVGVHLEKQCAQRTFQKRRPCHLFGPGRDRRCWPQGFAPAAQLNAGGRRRRKKVKTKARRMGGTGRTLR